MGNRFNYPDSGPDLITKNDPRVVAFFASLDRMLDKLEQMAIANKPMLNGERFLTDKEVCERLKMSRRTMQDWRNNGYIPFILLGGKILYRQSDVQVMLEKHVREAWR